MAFILNFFMTFHLRTNSIYFKIRKQKKNYSLFFNQHYTPALGNQLFFHVCRSRADVRKNSERE